MLEGKLRIARTMMVDCTSMAILSNLFQLMSQQSVSPKGIGPNRDAGDYATVDSPTITYDPQANGLVPSRQETLHKKVRVMNANEQFMKGWKDLAGAPGPQSATSGPHAGGAQSAPGGATAPVGGMASPPPAPQVAPVQIEGDHTRVLRDRENAPDLHVGPNGQISGDRGVLQAFTTAENTHDMAARYMGRNFSYPDGDKLTVKLDDPSASTGPDTSPTNGEISMPPDEPAAATDPDVVSHENGHAILMGARPQYMRPSDSGNPADSGNPPVSGNPRDAGNATDSAVPADSGAHPDSGNPADWDKPANSGAPPAAAMHEAFADSTSLLNSLQDPNVRKDVTDKLARGVTSNVASNLAEGFNQMPSLHEQNPLSPQPQKPWTPNIHEGLRNLAAPPPKGPESSMEPHKASEQFTSGFYHSVLAVNERLRASDPSLSSDAALKKATDIVGSDLMHGVDFLPESPNTNQGDLARAMMKADNLHHGAQYSDLYKKCFEKSNVPTQSAVYDAQEAATRKLGQNPALTLPSSLANGEAFRVNGPSAYQNPDARDPDVPRSKAYPAAPAADTYLQQHASQLGLPTDTDVRAQEMYHNDQGETFIYYSNGASRDDVSATHYVELGFNHDGHLIQLSHAEVPELEPGQMPGTTH